MSQQVFEATIILKPEQGQGFVMDENMNKIGIFIPDETAPVENMAVENQDGTSHDVVSAPVAPATEPVQTPHQQPSNSSEEKNFFAGSKTVVKDRREADVKREEHAKTMAERDRKTLQQNQQQIYGQ